MPKKKSLLEIRFSDDFVRLPVDEQSKAFNSIVNSVIEKFGLTFSPVPAVPNNGAGESSLGCQND